MIVNSAKSPLRTFINSLVKTEMHDAFNFWAPLFVTFKIDNTLLIAVNGE